MRSPSGSKEICNGSARERHRSQMCIGCGLNRIGGSNRTGGACMKTDGMVKSCLEIYSACNGAASLQLQGKNLFRIGCADGIFDTAGTQKEEKS